MTSRERRIGGYDVETGYDNHKKRQQAYRRDRMRVLASSLGCFLAY
jgi:hypothetical protein